MENSTPDRVWRLYAPKPQVGTSLTLFETERTLVSVHRGDRMCREKVIGRYEAVCKSKSQAQHYPVMYDFRLPPDVPMLRVLGTSPNVLRCYMLQGYLAVILAQDSAHSFEIDFEAILEANQSSAGPPLGVFGDPDETEDVFVTDPESGAAAAPIDFSRITADVSKGSVR